MKIYYAHSRKIYGTAREKKERDHLETLGRRHGRHIQIVCPNRDMGEMGAIEPYLRMVKSCDQVVCSEVINPANRKRMVGIGVFSEVQLALNLGMPVYVLRMKKTSKEHVQVTGVEMVNPDDWVYHGRLVTT